MKTKRLLTLVLCFFVLTNGLCFAEPEDNSAMADAPALSSSNWVLINMDDGEVLTSKGAEEKKYPASTTKIMTAILALENLDLEGTSTVSNNAVMSISWDSSKLGLYEGEVLKNYDLIAGMMVASGNDAANVLAEAVSGSVASFTELMNQKATEIGCTGTHFVNAHGLTDENHYTTAGDMAKIACYAMKNSTFRDMVRLQNYELPATEQCPDRRYFINTNNLITKQRTADYYYSAATGIKTGYTDAALHCLVSSAEKEGVRLIAVVLGASNIDGVNMSYPDTKALFDWGFEHYENKTIVSAGEIADEKNIKFAKKAKTAKLMTDGSFYLLCEKNGEEPSVEKEIVLDSALKAPLATGDRVGEMKIKVNGEEVGSVALTVDRDYEYSWWSAFFASVGKIFGIVIGIIVLAVIVLIIIRQVEYEKRRKERIRNRKKQMMK